MHSQPQTLRYLPFKLRTGNASKRTVLTGCESSQRKPRASLFGHLALGARATRDPHHDPWIRLITMVTVVYETRDQLSVIPGAAPLTSKIRVFDGSQWLVVCNCGENTEKKFEMETVFSTRCIGKLRRGSPRFLRCFPALQWALCHWRMEASLGIPSIGCPFLTAGTGGGAQLDQM